MKKKITILKLARYVLIVTIVQIFTIRNDPDGYSNSCFIKIMDNESFLSWVLSKIIGSYLYSMRLVTQSLLDELQTPYTQVLNS